MRNLEHICFRNDLKEKQMKMIAGNQGKAGKARKLSRLRPAFPQLGWRFQSSSAGQVKQAAS